VTTKKLPGKIKLAKKTNRESDERWIKQTSKTIILPFHGNKG